MMLLSAVRFTVHSRLDHMKNVLQALNAESRVFEEKVGVKFIKNLSEIHDDLMKVYDEMNLCYGFTSMPGMGLTFFYTLLTAFVIIKDFIALGHLRSNSLISIMFMIYYNFLFDGIILVNSLIKQKVKFDL